MRNMTTSYQLRCDYMSVMITNGSNPNGYESNPDEDSL
jgi:hypothetical protein